ncbi:MAG: hypothetical protein NW208_05555 [Bryobacter sp.]|nr:hypothetical protein [Bryobacter sp.]
MTPARQIPVAVGGWKPTLCLLVMAPISGELITSSAPPFVFFIPWVFTLFALLYGCGAILVRELAVRWGTGWAGVLLMGAAYGILEEALGAKSFFDPQWRAIGPLGVHGRWLGVNWVWAAGLTFFHAVFCIALSILTVSLPFRHMRQQRWLGNKSLVLVGVAYLLVLVLFFQKGNENHYKAPALYYWISIAVAVALIAAARWVPRRHFPEPSETSLSLSDSPAHYFAWLGFLSVLCFVVILYAVPATGVSAWVTGFCVVALGLGMYALLKRWSAGGTRALRLRQEVALVAGAFCAWGLQGPFQEWNPARSDSGAGMSAVGIACFVFSYWLWRRVAQNNGAEIQGGTYAS